METTEITTTDDTCCTDCASNGNTTVGFIAGSVVTFVGLAVAGKLIQKVRDRKAARTIETKEN